MAGRSHVGAMLTQGCLGPEGSAPSGQQGSRPNCAARMAWELDPEQLRMEQGPQGGGKESETTGHQTPELSTKNGRFQPCECRPWRSNRRQMGRAARASRREGGAAAILPAKLSTLSFLVRFCLKRGLHC